MSAPRLNRALALEHAVRTPDGAGGYGLSWETLGTLWAEVKALTGREAGGAAGPLAVARLAITVRAAPVGSDARPVAGQRFRDGTRVFAIRVVSEADPSGLYLLCQAEEEVSR